MLTRLPLPGARGAALRGGRAAWAWPLAGLAVAALAGLAARLALGAGLAPGLAAALALGVQAAATGALHEDGLADSADGLWGGQTRARRLEIMHDSRIGTYGALALGLSLLARWAALAALFSAGHVVAPLLAAAALSRAPMAVLAAALANARGSGLAQAVGAPPGATAALAVALALGLGLALTGGAVLAAGLWVALVSIGLAALAHARLGGQTGDILGASQQLAELAALAAFSASL